MIAFAWLVLWTIIANELSRRKCYKNSKKMYCLLMFVGTVILQGLRSIYIGGVDTSLVYARGFERVLTTPFSAISTAFRKDILFYYLTKLFTYLCTDFHVYIFLISCFTMWSFARFIYKYSNYPFLSYIIYYALGYYAVGFQMLRHIIALSILLFAYEYLLNRKILRFILVVFLAACFHSTALIFLIAYPIVKIKVSWKQWAVIFIAILCTLFAKNVVIALINEIVSNMDRYANYISNATQLSLVGAFILLCVYIAAYVFAYPALKKDSEFRALLNLSAVSIAFMALVTVIGEFHRISMFFGIYNTILLPNAWKSYSPNNRRDKNVILFAIVAILITYFLFAGLGNYDLTIYKFFWSD